MRRRNLIYIAVTAVICFPAAGLSLDSPGSSNPLGLGTVPPTAYKSGLIPSINPIDTSSNRVITGNVTGGMNFRGIVPYSSVTDFSVSPLNEMDSFLRRTEGSQVYENPGSGLTPYYSPLTTVSRIVPGTGGAVAPQMTSGYGVEPYPGAGQNIQLSPGLGYYQGRYAQPRNIVPGTQRPLSTNPFDIEKTIDVNAIQYTQAGPEEQTQEQFWRKMGVRTTQRTGLAEKRLGEKGLLKGVEPNIGFYLGENQPSQREAAGWTMRQQSVLGTQENVQPDVYEQMRMQVGGPAKKTEGLTGKVGEGTIGQILGVETGIQKTPLRPEGYAGQAESVASKGGETAAKIGERGAAEKLTAPKATKEEKTAAGVTANDVLLIYKSFASYHDDKFNRNMRLAEYYMKQGKFYRAADAYTMATVYKSQDPLGYAGKSIAMFATGEYMSSSLFLAKTLEIFPEYAKVRVDLVAIIGDKDTVENRILEAREWFDRSQSGELAFLLSYVYYQMDRLEFARQAIGFAAQQMPDSQAVATMKKAIEERIAKP